MNIRDMIHPRLLERGIPGTARVLRVTRTCEVSRSAQAGWHAPWVSRFMLLVSVPGRPAYRAVCRQYAPDLAEGATVGVAVGRWNPRRVVIDPAVASALAPQTDARAIASPDAMTLAVATRTG
jgi:hypothetical protein